MNVDKKTLYSIKATFVVIKANWFALQNKSISYINDVLETVVIAMFIC